MSVSGLKAELRLLESIFGKEHERFRIISWRLDELHCVFIQSSGGALTIHCNITESYPTSAPIWFVESDDPNLTSVLERLEDIKKSNTLLLQQLKRLICDLCRLYNLPQHPDVEMLDQPLPTGQYTSVTLGGAVCSLCLNTDCYRNIKEKQPCEFSELGH
ncbi:ubiquitin-conjugating enzyme E2 Q2 [Bombina bombina]|uniref:ubiquitin-conjugating enzyme E2 Q2 n=1 Tax=Bombina bombina TaxID=8345 RepID=UPI00235AE933|nr:ubiquitin-conjugating enzyme E2 Q2 [Bombina bombina]